MPSSTRSLRRFFAGLAIGSAVCGCATAATFTVTTAADTGAGSLRQAIQSANANPGDDAIVFAIPGGGVQTISVASPLTITDSVEIQGYTQPGSNVNTDPDGDNAVLTVELQGAGTDGLVVTGGTARISGLVLHGFQNAINLNAIGGSLVAGCWVGLLPTGLSAPGNAVGIWVHGTAADAVGDGTLPNRNVVSGNGVGIQIDTSIGSTVQGNLIGTNPAGTAALSNGTGVAVTSNALVGGLTAALGNVISGNASDGVDIGGTGSVVQANRIGLDATGFQPLGNGGSGVVANGTSASINHNFVSASASHGIDIATSNGSQVFFNFIGTNVVGLGELGNGGAGIHSDLSFNTVLGDNNHIANNSVGIWFEVPQTNLNFTIGKNSIYENGGLGIVLSGAPPAILPNGLGGDSPVITSVVPGATTTTISGYWDFESASPPTLQSASLDFYTSPACSKKRPWQFDEGQTYLGSTGIGGGGHMTFSYDAPVVLTNEVVTVTAHYVICFPQCFIPTGDGGFDTSNGNTPFSHRLPFSISPASGDPAGGQAITILGSNFVAGAAVTIAGQPVGSPSVASAFEIDATTPVLPAGTVGDVTVVNLDGSHGTIPMAYLADFLDVPPPQLFHDSVRTVVTNGIATGVGGGNFGVTASTLRQQMAVFLLKAKHGICYTPPACTGVFSDVPCPSLFADWIEALAAEGITGGCGAGIYCPTAAVRRDQMAAFLLKAEHGSTYVPPPCAGTFTDVACPSQFADWIEQLAAEGVTGGCGGSNYCPSNPNTRGQMAVFLTKTFHLQ